MNINGFDPKGYAEYIIAMADVEANKLALDQSSLVDALKKQQGLEWQVLHTAQKIEVLNRELQDQRKLLSKYAIEAAEHRESVVKLLHNLSDFRKSLGDMKNRSGQ
jgi:UDP-N-acetylglucosamine 2-epimerase